MTLAVWLVLLAIPVMPVLPFRTGRVRVPAWVGAVGVTVWLAAWWLLLD